MKKTKADSETGRGELPQDWTAELSCPGIVVTSRARVARNLANIPFPDRLTPEGRKSLCRALFRHVGETGDSRWTMEDLDALSTEELLCREESRLITPELWKHEGGRGLMLFRPDAAGPSRRRRRASAQDGDGRVASAMVNEEDHLRFQCIVPGGALAEAYQTVYEMESSLDGTAVEYAYDPTYGYLTSCPSNLGTGLRVGMMLHLVGLYLAGDLEKALNGLDRLGLEARGIHGEDSVDAPGCLYQISNAETLGESEEQILERTSDILRDIATQEDWARIRLFEQDRRVLEDYLCRSLAIGREARLMSEDEAVSLYYAVWFGLEMGLLAGEPIPGPFTRTRPFLLPATARKELGRSIDDADLSALRAEAVREAFRRIRIVC